MNLLLNQKYILFSYFNFLFSSLFDDQNSEVSRVQGFLVVLEYCDFSNETEFIYFLTTFISFLFDCLMT